MALGRLVRHILRVSGSRTTRTSHVMSKMALEQLVLSHLASKMALGELFLHTLRVKWD